MTDTEAGARTPDLVVYTAVFGAGYELPDRPPGACGAVCFTDRTDLEPRGWSLRVVRPLLPADAPRSSREQKIRPHRWLPEHQRSIYVDPTVELRTDPEELWAELVGDDASAWFGAFRHSYRDTLLGEIDAVLLDGLDAPERVHEHVRALTLTERTSLEQQPVWAGILARRHLDPRCEPAMEDWYAQVLRYSRRDQLSLPGVLGRAGADGVRLVDGDNRETSWHRWPRTGHVRPASYRSGAAEELVTDVVRAERATARVQELSALVEELRTERALLRVQVRDLDVVRADRDVTAARLDQVLSSRTWRWSAWLRGLRRGARRR